MSFNSDNDNNVSLMSNELHPLSVITDRDGVKQGSVSVDALLPIFSSTSIQENSKYQSQSAQINSTDFNVSVPNFLVDESRSLGPSYRNLAASDPALPSRYNIQSNDTPTLLSAKNSNGREKSAKSTGTKLKRSLVSLCHKMKTLGMSSSHDHLSSPLSKSGSTKIKTSNMSNPQILIQKSAQLDDTEHHQQGQTQRHRLSNTLFAVPLKECPTSSTHNTPVMSCMTPKTPRARYPSISTPNMNRVPQSFKPIALQPVSTAILKSNGTPNASKDDLRRSAYLNNSNSNLGHATPTAVSSIHDLSSVSSAKSSAQKPPLINSTGKVSGSKKLKMAAFGKRSVSASSVLTRDDGRTAAPSKHSFIQSLLGLNPHYNRSMPKSSLSASFNGSAERSSNLKGSVPVFSSDVINPDVTGHEVERSTQVLETALHTTSSQNIAMASSASSLTNLNHRKSTVKETFNINQTSTKTPELSKIIKEKLNLDTVECMINQYAVIKDIGQGSFSKVTLVYNTEDDRYYACKAISKKRLRKMNLWKNGPQRLNKTSKPSDTPQNLYASDPSLNSASKLSSTSSSVSKDETKKKIDHMDLVRHEIAILKRLSRHPHILSLIEVLDDQKSDSLYMIFELCEFGNIMKLKIGETVPCFTEDLARRYFRGLVLGLEYLHYSGVVHRDIKPENILLTAQNQAVIGDFSISYCTDVLQRSANGLSVDVKPPPAEQGNNLLTPMFTPPEFTTMTSETERQYTPASDIWSLGITLYCFVHGHLPFETLDLAELFENIRSSPIEKSPELTKSLNNLLDRLLERDPRRRIDLTEIRKHPWVTRNGKEPMPSKEENCLMLLGDGVDIDTITQEEIDRAVTPAIKLLDKIKERMKQAGGKSNKIRT